MIDTILSTVARALSLLRDVPIPAWAVAASVLASWGVTQLVKELYGGMRHRVLWTRLTAIGVAAVPALLIWPSRESAAAALAIGLASPLLWSVAVRILGHWLPGARDALSGDPE